MFSHVAESENMKTDRAIKKKNNSGKARGGNPRRKRAEESPKYSEEGLYAIFEQSPLSIQVFSSNGDSVRANRAWEDLWGSRREQLEGYNVLKDPQVKARGLLPYFEKALAGEVVSIPPVYYNPGEIGQKGRPRWTKAVIYPVKDASGQVQEVVLTHEDVTERYQADRSVLENEEHFRNLFENSPVAIWEEDFSNVKSYIDGLTDKGITDLDAYFTAHPEIISECIDMVKVLDVNRAALKLYEAASKSDLLGGLYKTFPSDSLIGFKDELLTIAKGELNFQSESNARTLQGKLRDVFVNWVVAPGHEQTYANVLVSLTDITERKQAEEKLRNAEAKYRTLLEQIPPIVYTAEPEQHIGITYISPQIEKLGFPQEEWIADPDLWRRQLHPEDRGRILAQLNELSGSDEPFQVEYRLITRSGQVRWFYDNAFPVKDAEGRTLFRQGFMLDITERKQAEINIRQYADIVQNMQIGLYVFHLEDREDDHSLRLVSANPAALQFSGVRMEEVVGKTLDEGFPDLREQGIPQKYAEVIRSQEAVEIEVAYYDDSQRLDTAYAVKAFPLPNNHLGVAFESTTERRQAENKLSTQEKRFRSLIENSLDNISLLAEDGALLWENPAVNRTLGYKQDEYMGRNLFELVHPDDLGWVSDTFASLIKKTRGNERGIFRLRHQNGTWRWIEAIATNLLREPSVKAIVINYRDVTESRQAEEALRQSQMILTQAGKMAHLGAWEIEFKGTENINDNPLRWSDEVYLIFGYEPGTVVVTNDFFFECVHPDDRQQIADAVSQAIAEKRPYQIEHRVIRPNGIERIVLEHADITFDEEGKPLRMLGAVQDITERKKAEQALREAEIKYRTLVEQLPAVTYVDFVDDSIKSGEFNTRYISPQVETLLGYTPAEFYADSGLWARLIHPDDRERVLARNVEHFSTHQFYGERYRMLTKKGHEIWVRDEAVVVRSENQEQTLISQGVIFDITEQKKVEGELRDREERFQQLADNIQEVFWITDPAAQKDLYLSPAYEEVWGRRLEDQMQNQNVFIESVLPEDREMVLATIEKQVRGKGTEMEYRITRPDGSIRWIWDRAFPIFDEFRSVKLVTGIAADITERKQAEAETIRYLAELQALYENGLAVGRLLSPQEIGERVIQTFTHYLSWHHVTIRLRRDESDDLELVAFSVPHLQEGEKEDVERNFNARISKVGQGLSGWVVQIGTPVRTGNVHTYPQYVNTYEMIQSGMYMPLKIGERVIGCISVESEKTDAFTAQDERLFATIANQAAVAFENARLYQATQQELFDRKHAEVMLERERNSLAQRVEERTTDLKRAIESLARALRVKDEFLANMSHELRTPLNAILGLSESLAEQVAGTLNEKQLKYVTTMSESGHHLLALINDILDLAKIEAGQITLDITRVDMESVCEASLRMVRQLAQKKNQEIELEMDRNFGLIWADERRLKQMIVNLLSNAVKFTPENRKIGLEVHGDKGENRVLITVWDDGIGIEENDLSQLFKPFVQLDAGLAREASGTGLGLALVAQMARLHGGSVSVASMPGHGSRFTIVIPWEPALRADTIERLKVTGKFRAIKPNGGKQQTILLIEDTKEVIMLIRDYLELAGYKVITAEDGIEGITQARLTKPDLILMDLQMPRMDGIEATQRLRSEPDFTYTPIIALTALAMPNDRERCLAAGMDEYISKPVNLKALVKIIQGFLAGDTESKNA